MSLDVSLRDRVEARIRNVVCPVCPFQTGGAGCGSPDPEGCAILRKLDQVISVIGGIHSDRLADYAVKLREVVCADCHNQNPDGTCRVREHVDCALDSLFGLVVEAVEAELAAFREQKKP